MLHHMHSASMESSYLARAMGSLLSEWPFVQGCCHRWVPLLHCNLASLAVVHRDNWKRSTNLQGCHRLVIAALYQGMCFYLGSISVGFDFSVDGPCSVNTYFRYHFTL